ncbi:MAG TPA: hypothetical protein VF546_24995 [Pyrinomonadaceae bacterium]|jgi:hypothetical protein
MERQAAIQSAEELVQSFLRAEDASEAENLLARLMQEHAEPIIAGIIKSKLRVSLNSAEGSSQNQDALEISGDVRAAVLAEMQRLKAAAQGQAISSFQNYVAVKTYSACADYFRAKNPQRRRLKDLLRHHLKQNRAFALWEAEDRRWLCGLQSWRGAEAHTTHSDRLQRLLTEPLSIIGASESASAAGGAHLPAADLLTAIFESVGHPVEFNHLVTIVAAVWGIRDQPDESFEPDGRTGAGLVDSAAGVDVVVEQRLYLQTLWTEVSQLPPLQRSALLLNLRDAQGGSVIAFVPHLGIATRAEIAALLAIPAEQFAGLWPELPLDDASIARLLGVTRQQVINLRKTARERLARRMKALEKNAGGNK